MTAPEAFYARGARGKSIHAGDGAPTLAASNGDLYVNHEDGAGKGDLYERVDGAWVLVGNIGGPAGADSTVPGPPNELSIGTVASGAEAGASITGEAPAQELNLTLPQGDSAYQVAVDNGFVGSESAWLASLAGEDGDEGPSAYAVAVSNGFVGTESEWVASLKGEPGDEGPPGAVSESQLNTTVSNAVSALVGSSPATLDTLEEIAAALGNDPEFATTILDAIAGRVAGFQNGSPAELSVDRLSVTQFASITPVAGRTYLIFEDP